jgi:hypothetical protein
VGYATIGLSVDFWVVYAVKVRQSATARINVYQPNSTSPSLDAFDKSPDPERT